MGEIQPSARTLQSSAAEDHAPRMTARSESMMRGAGCLNWARPDLWEAGEGNFPGLPDDTSVRFLEN
ncbi:MAG: hypothetical protein GY847_20280 [Proteobacteria bacterium]|nr:hypothetical protein [Pseudomonadota bacterium]